LERWLHWFFCAYRYRSDRLADLTHDGLPIWSHANELRDVLIELERSSNPVALYARVQNDGSDSPFYRSGALPAVLAELLLAGDHPTEAFAVLQTALVRFPDDL